jgi:hypothetical protein
MMDLDEAFKTFSRAKGCWSIWRLRFPAALLVAAIERGRTFQMNIFLVLDQRMERGPMYRRPISRKTSSTSLSDLHMATNLRSDTLTALTILHS